MAKRKKAPELTFQQHITDYLVPEHMYGVLEQADIIDNEQFIAEDQLWVPFATSATSGGRPFFGLLRMALPIALRGSFALNE